MERLTGQSNHKRRTAYEEGITAWPFQASGCGRPRLQEAPGSGAWGLASQGLPYIAKRTRLYDIAIPIVSPQAWEWHRHETTAEWSARGAEWDADGESLRGVLSGRRRSERD